MHLHELVVQDRTIHSEWPVTGEYRDRVILISLW